MSHLNSNSLSSERQEIFLECYFPTKVAQETALQIILRIPQLTGNTYVIKRNSKLPGGCLRRVWVCRGSETGGLECACMCNNLNVLQS